jgi:hypothetical protein
MRLPCVRFTVRRMMGLVVLAALLSDGIAAVLDRPWPRAVLRGNSVYRFGMMGLRTIREHDWVIENAGRAPLQVWIHGGVGCWGGVTTPTLDGRGFRQFSGESLSVAPGGRATIRVDWWPREETGGYDRYVDLGTNDPEAPTLRLAVKGVVTPWSPVVP